MKKIMYSSLAATILFVGIILVSGFGVVSISPNITNVNYQVKFHVSGCDACTGLTYCIDGGTLVTVNSCQFVHELPIGTHSICVQCPYNKKGTLSFYVSGNFLVQDEYLTVQNDNGQSCPCSGSKL